MENVKLIIQRLNTAQSRLKYYASVRRRELEVRVDRWVFLKVTPMKGVMIFGKKGKLIPIYVGPHKIMKRIGKVADELELPADLAAMHPIFYISLLMKYVGDLASVVPSDIVAVNHSLSYENMQFEILDRQVRWLTTKNSLQSRLLGKQKQP
ncbi:uncharacterized protein [Solanum lycopersicum]|uniref:uncharacterized protein n=1 Tax=Solanum lycopersicum TaxID=4081 RepID=UPI0002766BE8|nr:uncharacterized protein LOC109120048 [Solanum lycopersicum]